MVQGRTFWFAPLLIAVGVAAHAAPAPTEAVPGEYIVTVKNSAQFANRIMSTGTVAQMRVVSPKNHIYMLKESMLQKPANVIAQLKKDPNVLIAEPNYIYHATKETNDPDLSQLWGMHNDGKSNGRAGVDIGATKAWDIETGSKNVIVAVIDTGIDYNHEDLKDNMWTNMAELNGKTGVDDDKNGYVDDIHGYNFATDTGDPMDDFGHGTHCAGTIGAKGGNGIGVVGVNWNVSLMAVKFLDSSGSGTLENAIKAIDYATNMGAMIESNSWGGGGESDTLKAAIERARDKGVLFVAAAGNDDSNNDDTPSYPASYDVDNVISVAAIDNQGNTEFNNPDGSFWWGSNYGVKTVHIAAPGHLILSTVPTQNADPEIMDPSGYKVLSGTSMATPHVSGVAALLKAHFPNMTYAQIKQRILDTAVPLASLKDKVMTGGVVNAYYALINQKPPPDPMDPSNWATENVATATPHPYPSGATHDYKITVPGAKAVAVYFDKFQLEKDYDFVQIKDGAGNVIGKLSGTHDGQYSQAVPGDTVVLTLVSDPNVSEYGFDVSKVAYH